MLWRVRFATNICVFKNDIILLDPSSRPMESDQWFPVNYENSNRLLDELMDMEIRDQNS